MGLLIIFQHPPWPHKPIKTNAIGLEDLIGIVTTSSLSNQESLRKANSLLIGNSHLSRDFSLRTNENKCFRDFIYTY